MVRNYHNTFFFISKRFRKLCYILKRSHNTIVHVGLYFPTGSVGHYKVANVSSNLPLNLRLCALLAWQLLMQKWIIPVSLYPIMFQLSDCKEPIGLSGKVYKYVFGFFSLWHLDDTWMEAKCICSKTCFVMQEEVDKTKRKYIYFVEIKYNERLKNCTMKFDRFCFVSQIWVIRGKLLV